MYSSKLFILVLLCSFPVLLFCQTTTIILKPGPLEGKDADIRNDYPNQPLGISPNFIANAWTVDGHSFIQRSLIQFDLSQIAADSQLLSASLSLFCNKESGHHQLQSGFNQCYLQRILSNWDENNVNWTNQPPTTTANQTVISTSNLNTQDYPNIDVTMLIKNILVDHLPNYGFMLKLSSEVLYSCMVFASSDHPIAARRPELKLVFSGCSSPVSSFTYQTENKMVSFVNSSQPLANYYWDFGDNYYSSVKHPQHEYENPGIYHVCLISMNDCGSDTLCKDIEINGEPSISHIPPDFIIYPNPTSGIFFMKFLSDFQPFTFTLFNPIGQEILNKEFTTENFSSPHEFNITYLGCGLYILKIQFEQYRFLWKEVLMQ